MTGVLILTAAPVILSKLNKKNANNKTMTAEIITFLLNKSVYIT